MKKIGIDIGGTFTDLILQDQKGISIAKVPSTPQNPEKAALVGIEELISNFHVHPEEVDIVAHGSTISTNAVIQRKGAKTGLITTKGFRDALEIGRLGRPPEAIYNIQYEKPLPLVPRHLRMEVEERVNSEGKVLQDLREDQLSPILKRIKEEKIDSLAICLLFSYLNPHHERRLRELIGEALPDLPVLLSSEILPEFREYERTSATVINAYIEPVVSAYLARMKGEFRKHDLEKKFYIMQSNGGLTTPEVCIKKPSATILSGPSGGVIGAGHLAGLAGFDNIITIDMGGTSYDVSLVQNARPIISTARNILGYPLVIPMIDIQTIGAGGGSIAWIDSGGILRVGPQSAGANPGPACYGLGAEDPTVTDADMVLGFLNPDYFLGGRVKISVDKALESIRVKVAEKLKISPLEAAEGIYRIVNANMAGATRLVSIEKGYDPRDFALVAFGGAGPVHAAEIAEELEIPWTIVPRYPGVTSAYGLIVAELIHDYVQTARLATENLDLKAMNKAFEALERQGAEDLALDGIAPRDRRFTRSADVRYSGQVYSLNVPVPAGTIGEAGVKKIIQRFNAAHESIYGFKVEVEPVEIVNLRCQAMGLTSKWKLPQGKETRGKAAEALKGKRKVYFRKKGFVPTLIYSREKLLPGHKIQGPAVIEQVDSTIVVPPGLMGTVDRFFNIILGKKEWKGNGQAKN